MNELHEKALVRRARTDLVHWDLQRLHGDGPDVVAATLERVRRERAHRRKRHAWGIGALVAAAVAVVWAVLQFGPPQASTGVGTGALRSPTDRRAEDLRPQDPLPSDAAPTHVVRTPEELAAVPADADSLRWVEAAGDLGALKRFTNLRALSLRAVEGGKAPSVRDAGWALAGLGKLERLHLEGFAAAEPGNLAPLGAVPNLATLRLDGKSWTGALSTIPYLPSLTRLEVRSVEPLTAKDLAHVASVDGLQHLSLWRLPDVDSERVTELVRSLRHLRSLALLDVSVDETTVATIAGRKGLVGLDLHIAHPIEAEWLDPVWARSDWLRLSLGYGGGFTVDQLEGLRKMQRLRHLSLGGATTLCHHWVPPAEFWTALCDLEALRHVDFHRAYHIRPGHLAPMKGRVKLETVVLQRPGWGPDATKGAIARALLALEVELQILFPEMKTGSFVEPPEMGGRSDLPPPGGFGFDPRRRK